MSDLTREGFNSSLYLAALGDLLANFSETEREKEVKKTKGIFQFTITNKDKQEESWTIDLKKDGKVVHGPLEKPDIIISLTGDTFVELADNKLDPQKAYLSGKIKTKGNLMLALKLKAVLSMAKAKVQAKL
ncbi:hypothetical protein BOTBODRAFT_31327 [Botryobasidium botryosum FD-172 SS1]|uniref:SCP2 domain-containing protein n=1 Tax=Botryobasidium botryosum (strain FD-172 SS1) TaxID=930990 RepID=A0A067MVJ7_BOTB1|nr:hypothetical protein BOTBODRAFT_31327 [Botryobasidium botryosum FD-172 SS1]